MKKHAYFILHAYSDAFEFYRYRYMKLLLMMSYGNAIMPKFVIREVSDCLFCFWFYVAFNYF